MPTREQLKADFADASLDAVAVVRAMLDADASSLGAVLAAYQDRDADLLFVNMAAVAVTALLEATGGDRDAAAVRLDEYTRHAVDDFADPDTPPPPWNRTLG